MAQVTSGSVSTNSVSGYGLTTSFTLNWSATQSVANNTSTISWNLVTTQDPTGSGYRRTIYNAYVTIDDTTYNLSNQTSVSHDTVLMSSNDYGTKTITHNTDGTKSFSISIGVSVGQSSTNCSGNDTFELKTIPRYTSITSFTVAKRTETSFTINWQTANIIDYVWFSTNNGSSWTGYNITDGTSGNFTTEDLGLTLSPNTTYNCKLRVRRKDSQLTTDSSTVTQTTNAYPQFATQPTYNARTETTLDVTYKPNMTVALAQYRIKTSGGSYGSWVNINSNNIISGSATSTTGCTFRISSLTANTNYVVQVRLKSTLSDSYTNSNEVSSNMYTYNYPYLISATDYIIGNPIPIKLYNPLKRQLTIYFYGNDNSQIDIANRSIDGDTNVGYTPEEITAHYASIPNTISGNSKIRIVCSALGRDTTVNGAKYSINTSVCVPTFNDFEYSTNGSSLTGNYDTIIKGVTTTTFTISTTNKATHNYGASITKYRLECGDQKEDVTYSSSQSVSGTVANCSNQTIKVSAIDSRGLETSVTKTVTNFKDYSKPTFRSISADRNDGVEATTKLSFTANYWNGNFGIVDNSIVRVQYRSKLTTSSTYGSYTDIPVSSLTVNNGIVTLSDYLIHANGSSGGFEVGKAYNLEVRIRDGKNTSTYLITTYGYANITDGNVAFSTFQDSEGQYHIGFNGMPSTATRFAVDGEPLYDDIIISSSKPTTDEKIWIQRGKNLFNNKFRQGGVSDNTSTRVFSAQNLYLKAGTYTLSSNFDTSTYQLNAIVSSSPFPNTVSSFIYDSPWITSSTFTFTTQQDGYFGLNIRKIGNIALTPSDISSYNYMLNSGDTALPYENYVEKKVYTKNNDTYEELNDIENGGISTVNLGGAGNYTKFPDGTLICTKTVTITTAISTQWGSMYESSQIDLGRFAHAFIERPVVFGTCVSGSVAFLENITPTATSWGNTYLARPSVGASTNQYKFDLVAIGRWK